MNRSILCLTLTADSWQGVIDQIEAHRPWMAMAEVRVDLFKPEEQREPSSREAARLKGTGFPLILTLRLPEDGGQWRSSEISRMNLFVRLLATRLFDWADVEAQAPAGTRDAVAAAACRAGCRVLSSFHEFEGIPADFEKKIVDLAAHSDGVKAAVTPHDAVDLSRLLAAGSAFTQDKAVQGKTLVLAGMGDTGRVVRILSSRFGSSWSYGSPQGECAAPGQMDVQEMQELYRFSSLDESTQVCAIIGNPLGQSRSPHIHNPALVRAGVNGVYIPLSLPSLEGLPSLAEALPLQGFSVTVPYKQAVIPFLAERDEAVSAIGACNTVVCGARGWSGLNTDAPGFMAALKKQFPDLDPRQHRVTLVGAGGAARALLFALTQAGFPVLVLNRTLEKAKALTAELGGQAAVLNSESAELLGMNRDLIVQSTSAGMTPWEEVDPLEWYSFQGDERLVDIVYKPPVTRLMARAAEAGCTVFNGMDMLQKQAELQFTAFTGQPFP